MLKLLIKKQILEFVSSLLGNKSKNIRQRNFKIIIIGVLFLYVFVVFGVLVYFISTKMCDMLNVLNSSINDKIDWFYFVLFSFVALAFNLVSGIISSSSILYDGKDNELLFSLPIKPKYILLSRISEVYLLNFLITAIIYIPAYIAYFVHVEFSELLVINASLILLFLPLLTTAISSIGGYVISTLSSKVKSKNLIKIIATLAFLGGYFYLTTFSEEIMNGLLKAIMTSEVAKNIKTYAYPFYIFGKGAAGDVLSILIFSVFSVAAFVGVFYLILKNYFKIATASTKTAKKAYTSKSAKQTSIFASLLKKEFKRFFGCAAYLLNCGIGAVFAIAIGVLVLIKGKSIIFAFIAIEFSDNLLLPISCVTTAACSLMTPISAPSISLEGESLWILRSLPIDTKKILNVKILAHIIFVSIPMLFLCISLGYSFDFSSIELMLLIAISFSFVLLTDFLGIWASIKFPNQHWKNEMVAVKQGPGILVAMLGTMGALISMVGAYFFLEKIHVGMIPSLCIILCLILILNFVMHHIIKTKGVLLFEKI